ncbi:MAG: hypothetical protein GXY43_08890 [Clostridiaceae bacterium]|nr:hypothetical protein [Clostridiaceae bacterium]
MAEDFSSETYPEEKTYFEPAELSYLSFSEEQEPNAISMTACGDLLAVLVRSIAKDGIHYQTHMCFFDRTGVEIGSFCFESVLETDNVFVSYVSGKKDGITAYITVFDNKSNSLTNGFYSFDTSGNMLRDAVDLTFSDTSFSPTGLFVLQSGETVLSGICSEGNVFYMYSTDMKYLYTISGDQLTGKILESGGDVYVESRMFTDGTQEDILYNVDMNTGNLTSSIDVSQITGACFTASNSGKLYAVDAQSLYLIDLDGKKKIALVNWSDLNIDRSIYSSVSPICILSDDVVCIRGTAGDAGYDTGKVVMLTRQDNNPNIGKQTIFLGGFYLSDNTALLSTITKFNQSNEQYRIEIKDYFQSIDWSQPLEQIHLSQEACRQQMYLDAFSGKGPDIIYDVGTRSLAAYEANNLLMDMCPLMEMDPEFDINDFLPNVIDACTVDGKLCKIPAHFWVYGIEGEPSVTKGISSWSTVEFDQIASALPSGMYMIVNTTQLELLRHVLAGSMNLFIDDNTKEVNFNTDEFFKILKWAKTYGEKEPVSEELRVYVNTEELLEKNLLVCNTHGFISDASKFASIFPRYYGTAPDIIGYPSPAKNGPYIYPIEQVAISSSCDSPGGAWSFVKYLLSEDYQTMNSSGSEYAEKLGTGYGFPVRTESLQALMEIALNPPEIVEEFPSGDSELYPDPYEELYGMTQERADACLAAVNSADTLYYLDEEIYKIIQEEVTAYFEDLKSVEDVTALIQNRVQTLVSERE